MDSSFTKAVVQVPHLSGFDKSHQNLFTSKVGTITPILIDELIPGSKFDLKLALNASLPPLATDTFMRCSVKVEAFLVPFRLLAGSFESWFTDTAVSFQNGFGSGTTGFTDRVGFLPCIGNLSSSDSSLLTQVMPYFTAAGSLADYLGMKQGSGTSIVGTGAEAVVSALPWLAYHRIYDDWYRNTLVQRPVFVRPGYWASGGTGVSSGVSPSSGFVCAGTAPYYFFTDISTGSTSNYVFSTADHFKLADGTYLYQLRQRNFGLDYFTTATPSPQLGNAQSVTFSTSGSTGSFSIAALRAANSLQQFEERNNLAGTRYQDQLRARYGANLSNGVAQRCIFLGSGDFEVYSKGVYQSQVENSGDVASSNPFNSVAARYGSAYAQGSDFHVSGSVDEPCYLFVNATLVPRVTYSSGVHRRITHFRGAGSLADLANPILQNVGPQPIYIRELTGSLSNVNIFGYTDRYAEYKTMEDELHGIMRDGSSLSAFALQRSFANNASPSINTSFLEIPTTYMDQITAVTADLSNYGWWCDSYFDYKVSQPLAKYSLPSLQDPAYEHGKGIVVTKSGQRL